MRGGLYLNAWTDFDRNGIWEDPGEQAAVGLFLEERDSVLSSDLPETALPGRTWGRLRFSTQADLGSTGLAPDGEVEDRMFVICREGSAVDIVMTDCVRNVSGEMVIQWRAESGVVHEAQSTTDMPNGTDVRWTASGGYVIGPGKERTDSHPVEPLKTYRVMAPFAPPSRGGRETERPGWRADRGGVSSPARSVTEPGSCRRIR